MADVMLPSELQMCVPVPARARMHTCTVGWCVMARGGAKACGAGAAARCSGVGWSGGLATARGATSDVLAAVYLSEGQAEQPVLQLESHEANVSQPESQLEGQYLMLPSSSSLSHA